MIIKEAVLPTIMWRKGPIVDSIKKRDEEIQGVMLVIIDSKSEKVELSRPIHHHSLSH